MRSIINLALLLILAAGLLPGCLSKAERATAQRKEHTNIFPLLKTDAPAQNRGMRVSHYPASNEMRIDLFRPYVENLGGIYIGVGTDQNLTFIAWAKSDFAYLMDFDAVAVYVNRIHFFFIERSPTFADYETLWKRVNKASSLILLKKTFGKSPDWHYYQEAFLIAHRGTSDVPERFADLRSMARRFGLKTFVNDPADYTYIRTMLQEGRIQAIPGDLMGTVTLREIARKSQAMQRPVRLLYTSNAEEYFRYPDAMRANFANLPTDAKSRLIRTMSTGARRLGFPEGEKFPESVPLHYNVQSLPAFQAWMRFRPDLKLKPVYMVVKRSRMIRQGLSLQTKSPADLNLKDRVQNYP